MEKMTGERLAEYLRSIEDDPAALPSDDETSRPSPLPPDLADVPKEDPDSAWRK